MTEPLTIEFHHDGHEPLDAPMPVPMRQAQPGWFTAMGGAISEHERQAIDKSRLTLRACAPFAEAMGFGYAMLWPLTLTIHVDARRPDGAYDMRCQPPIPAVLESHPPSQTPGMPSARFPILKLLSPWIIRTPPGTSCLITPLVNRPEQAAVPFSAVVETDRYFNAIHFPFLLAAPVGGVLTLQRGEPFAQIMPFRRDDWTATRGTGDAEAHARTRGLLDTSEEGAYARNVRVRRSFT